MLQNLGLYLHIPFCLQKCAYCDFYSLCTEDLKERYTDALLLHMQDYAPSAMTREVDSVFIGGGTPTTLPRNLMLSILGGVKRHFNLSPEVEWTMESNPATTSRADLRKYRRAGVNRLSIGLQSIHEEELSVLGRIHTAMDFENAFYDARDAGFENISVDLIYGIPGQTRESLKATLEKVISYEPEHISLYNLILEEGTPLYDARERLDLPDEDTEYEMYEAAVIYLESHGYYQYEISNFARPGFECRHNLKYWSCEEYLGLGPAAHSYYHGRRFSFKRDLMGYIRMMEQPELLAHPASVTAGEAEEAARAGDILDECYDLSENERVGEYVMLRMRLKEGVDTEDFARRFGMDFERMYSKYLKLYTQNGFMNHVGSRYFFTLKGMYVSNYILSAMLDFDSDSDLIHGIVSGSDKV